jgi:5'(3')-deoxyribonucleotidase
MKRIAIDMDDVMADTTFKIIQYINERISSDYTYDGLMTANDHVKKAFYESYIANNDFLWEPGFFEDIPVKPDAVEVIQALQEKYEVFIVSAATEFPNSMKEKLNWISKYFPFIGWQHTVFCGHKHMILADYLIDDHEKNLKTFTGTPLLFTAPHNLHIHDYERVNTWLDVKTRLLG